MWKWLLGLFVIAVAACGVGGYFLGTSPNVKEWAKQFNPDEKIIEVKLEPVMRGNLSKVVSAPGRVEPKTKVEISAQVAARITALPFREGEPVKKGDVLVRLDAREMAAQLESAQAGLKSEQARLEGAKSAFALSESDLGRQRDLFGSKDVSQSTLDQAVSTWERSQSELRMAEQAIEIARANIIRAEQDLEYATIMSPLDGTIIRLAAEVGELVLVGTLNNPASVILEVADLDNMLVRARVDESNIAPVKDGQPAKVFINAFPDETFIGVVENVKLQRQTEQDGTQYFESEVLVENPGKELLRDGMTANVDIEVDVMHEVLKIPSQAVVDRRVDDLPKTVVEGPNAAFVDKSKPFARVVYVVQNGKALAKPVSVGSSDLTHTVVIGGLSEGDKIITGPFKVLVDLKDDKKVAEEGTLKKKDTAKDSAKEVEAVEAK
ncbi:MAG: efflux RND transporter periplasmic adaptor subunit [Phycisphaerales bacterium]|nr:efflux RND transporter periplasmic adaptor subunit [Phycisphaerales bacterium]